MGRIFTIGEALIDFIPAEKGKSLKNVSEFKKMPGGAPANVAVAASKLGSKAYFIGKVGKDAFGDFLKETLESYDVDTSYMSQTSKAKTALAFVSLNEYGDRDFSFYRNPSADLLLSIEDVENIEVKKGDFVSFCSVSLVDYPVKYSTEYFLKKARSVGATVLFDPNVRKDLWGDLQECRSTTLDFIRYADILKISDDEIEFITAKNDIDSGIEFLRDLGVKNIILTLGERGSEGYFGDIFSHVDGVETQVVDTTGAGDSFVGSTLHMLERLGKDIEEIEKSDLDEILKFSNEVAALVTTKKGAMNSLPSKSEVYRG